MEEFRKSELDAAEAFEGKKVPLSGAGATDKLDVLCGGKYETLGKLENKYTEKGSYTLKAKYLKECERFSRIEGKRCIMRIDFKGIPYIVIREDWFKDLFND